MRSLQRTISNLALLVTGVVCLLAYAPRSSVMAGSPALIATADLGTVRAVGVTGGRPPIYVATDTGLYRATSQTYAFWSRQRALTDVLALAPTPSKPQDLVYTRLTGLFRSTDGGRTARFISPACNDIALARSTRVPTLIYGGSPFGCGRQPVNGYPGTYSLERSADDGLSWTTVFTDVDSYIYDHNANFGRIAIDPIDANRVFAADTNARRWGELLGSTDGGRHWTVVQESPADYTTPTDIAIDPLNPADVWVAWGGAGVYHSLDRGHTWHRITRGLPPLPDVTAVQVDPLTGRAYISLSLSASDTNSTGLYAIGKGERVEAFALTDQGDTSGYSLRITRNGYLLAWHYIDPGDLTLINPPTSAPLTVRPLIGPGTWAVSSVFTSTAALRAARLLGGAALTDDNLCGPAVPVFRQRRAGGRSARRLCLRGAGAAPDGRSVAVASGRERLLADLPRSVHAAQPAHPAAGRLPPRRPGRARRHLRALLAHARCYLGLRGDRALLALHNGSPPGA